jgi:hypothetical protein
MKWYPHGDLNTENPGKSRRLYLLSYTGIKLELDQGIEPCSLDYETSASPFMLVEQIEKIRQPL